MASQHYHSSSMDARELEAGLPFAHSEKTCPVSTTTTTHPEHRQEPRETMFAPRRLFLGLAVGTVLWLGLTTAAPAPQDACLQPHGDANVGGAQVRLAGGAQGASAPKAESPFSCLMDAASPEALHEVLHRYFPNRFKDGVYESDHSAMEAVHRADPPLATSLVRIARRQAGGNGTTTSPTEPPPPPRTTTPPTTSLPTTTANQPDTTPSLTTTTSTRAPASNTGTLTSSVLSSPSSFSTPLGSVVSTTTSVPVETSPGTVDTNQGSAPPPTTTSSTSPRTQKPQTTTYTSTASNGDVVVVTATTFVPAEPAETHGGGNGAQPGGSLQTNAAVPRPRGVGVEAFAGVVIGGLFLV